MYFLWVGVRPGKKFRQVKVFGLWVIHKAEVHRKQKEITKTASFRWLKIQRDPVPGFP